MDQMTRKIKTYSELIQLPTFEERYDYCYIGGKVGSETFGYDRYINQVFYHNNKLWKKVRNYVITRDRGCDLGVKDCDIVGTILIHHMNPISLDDILNSTDFLLNPEYLISVSLDTHNGIHYGSKSVTNPYEVVERFPNDTCPWKR